MKNRTNINSNMFIKHVIYWLLATLLTATLYGCGDTVSPTSTGPTTNLQRTSFEPDVIAFDTSVRTPIFRQYCKGCHEPGGNGTGEFADKSDIENAYNHADSRINRDTVTSSLLVQKVTNGHNCWPLGPTADCAQSGVELTNAINAWLNADSEDISDGGTDEVQDIDVVSKLNIPVDSLPRSEAIVLDNNNPDQQAQFEKFIFTSDAVGNVPYIAQHCRECHSANAIPAKQQTPYFATEDDPALAFKEAIENRKIDINSPENSRMYIRLLENEHNCWSDCAADAEAMKVAITAWKTEIEANGAPPPPVDGAAPGAEAPISNALTLLDDGQVLSGGKRYERNIIALWEFKNEATDANIALDSSGVFPKLDLILNENTEWVSGWGIEFKAGGRALGTSIEASQKLYDLIAPRNEYSIEAWIVPANVTQEGPAIIASYSSGAQDRNFSMGQTLYSYEFLNRNTASGLDAANTANGNPTLITDPDDEDLQATQQHVVMTYDPVNGRRIYVNGEFTGDNDTVLGGSLSEWNDGYLFVLGAETNGDNGWLGKIRLAAIYSRALSQEQIQQNFDAGVGQKFNLLFRVGHLSSAIPENSYIWFEVSEYDNFSYLFSDPAFVVLDDKDPQTSDTPATFNNFNIQGLRIGVNGKEAPVGQVFLNLNKDISLDLTDPSNPRYENLIDTTPAAVDGVIINAPINATGTIIAKQKGVDGDNPDQFYLTFKSFGGINDVRTENTTITPLEYNYAAPVSGLTSPSGMRTFEAINATMSAITGVPLSTNVKDPDEPANTNATATVYEIFKRIEQQLPSTPSLQGFLSSQQIAIAKLGLTYCGAMINSPTLRSNFFGNSFEFDQPVATAFNSDAKKDLIVNALYNKMVISNLDNQPTADEVKSVLFGASTGLYDNLDKSCSSNADCVETTQTIVKAMCVSVLSSAVMLEQ
ncbi:MAG: LamG domain-containing protein [Gammaproteobacteria bacterium]|nr:LamG domain-containing protein [Gammaproteobacteria bacterium]